MSWQIDPPSMLIGVLIWIIIRLLFAIFLKKTKQ